MSKPMTKIERKLHVGAELHLTGSGDLIVTIYRCVKDFRILATINAFLKGDCHDRGSMILSMREQVADNSSTRAGPKHDRHQSAVDALDNLAEIAGVA